MNDTEQLVEIIGEIAREVAAKRGAFDLFALFARDVEAPWDVIVSSEWAARNRRAATGEVAALLQSRLPLNQIVTLAGIVVLDPNDPAVLAARRLAQSGPPRFRDAEFERLSVAQGIVLAWTAPPATAPAATLPRTRRQAEKAAA